VAGLAVVGDLHGVFTPLARIVAGLPDDVEVIQVGDFGYWPYFRRRWQRLKLDVRFVDGNHDHVVDLLDGKCDWPGAYYMERGAVREVAGRRILFLGGSTSVDRAWRPHGSGEHCWFDEEIVRVQDVERAIREVGDQPVDLMVTHTPPDWMIRKHFSPDGLRRFGHDPDTWRDLAALRVEDVWRQIGEPPLVCGHMHRSVVDGQCRILNINECVMF